MKRYYYICFILAFLMLCFTYDKKQVYFFNYKVYYSAFEDKGRIYNYIKKKLNRNFYKVKEINIKSLSLLPNEINKILKSKSSGIIYLDSSFYSLLLKSEFLQQSNKFKLLTYNMPSKDVYLESNISIFNITVDSNALKDNIIDLMKLESKSDDFSDCIIIINPNFMLCTQFKDDISDSGFNIDFFEAYQDDITINEYLEKSERNIVVFFGYNANKFLSKVKKENYKRFIFIEALTEYGENTNIAKYNLNINWERGIFKALNSIEFKNFADKSFRMKKNQTLEESIINYSLSNEEIIVKKNTR